MGSSTSVNAAVLNTGNFFKPRATQSYKATEHGFWNSYSIWIGVPYDGTSGFDATYNVLQNSLGNCITNWQCVKSDDGNIQLWFNTPPDTNEGYGGRINSWLGSRFPSVDSFNCPDD